MVKNIILILLITIFIKAEDIRYFKSISRLSQEVIFEGKIDNKSLPQRYWKVYYKDKKLDYAEFKGKNIKEKNTIIKFNKDGKEVYSNTPNMECYISYGKQYKELNCTSKDKFSTIRTFREQYYFENDILKTIVRYENEKFSNYAIYSTLVDGRSIDYYNILFYDKNGKYIDEDLKNLKESYAEISNFDFNKKSKILKLIMKRETEILDIPDLNLTLKKQYIKKIDRLNNRGGIVE